MAIQISLLHGYNSHNNNQSNKLTRRALGVLALGLLYFPASLSWAAGYSVAMLTPEKINNTTYKISPGNQSLNSRGQVIGSRRVDSNDGFYTFGNRALLWTNGKMQVLGSLGTDDNGYGESTPTALNDAGQVAGVSRYFVNGIDRGYRAFRWNSSKKMQRINTDGAGFFSSGMSVSINAKGDIYGDGYYEKGVDNGMRAFVTLSGKVKNLGTFGTDVDGNNAASGFYDLYTHHGSNFNNKGQAVGTSSYYDKTGENLGQRAFLWTNNKLVNLGALGTGGDSGSIAINDSGQVVGNSTYFDKVGNLLGVHAFLWSNGKMTDLGTISASPAGASYSYAIAINAAGQVLGKTQVFEGNVFKGWHGFLWFKGTMTDLGTLGAGTDFTDDSEPIALNNKGQVVGGSSFIENGFPFGFHAFLYQKGKMLDLNTLLPKNSGWLLENALAINDKGQITVYGTYTKGTQTYKGYALLTPGKQ